MIVILLFVLCLLFSSYSYAQSDKEILFRSIPWNSSFKTVSNSQDAYGIKIIQLGINHFKSKLIGEIVNEGTYNYSHSFSKQEDNNAIVCRKVSLKEQVAGYDASSLLYFSYSIKDNTIVSDADNAVFFMGAYEFDIQKTNIDDFEKDMLNKLTLLYGNVDKTKTLYQDLDGKNYEKPPKTLSDSSEIRSWTWRGNNDTVLIMEIHKSNLLGNSAYMLYAWQGIDDTFRQIDQIYHQKLLETISNSNLNGL